MSHEYVCADRRYTWRRAPGKYDRGAGDFTIMIPTDDRDMRGQRRVMPDVYPRGKLAVRADIDVVPGDKSGTDGHPPTHVKAFSHNRSAKPEAKQDPRPNPLQHPSGCLHQRIIALGDVGRFLGQHAQKQVPGGKDYTVHK